jgi:hypothetical protein
LCLCSRRRIVASFACFKYELSLCTITMTMPKPAVVEGSVRSESRGNNEGRALSDRLLKCVYCTEKGKLGTGKHDFLVVSCRCSCGAQSLELPDGAIPLQHRPCGCIMTYSNARDELLPYSVVR